MKKRLTSMVMALFVACSLIVPVGAVDSPECMEITPIAQDEVDIENETAISEFQDDIAVDKYTINFDMLEQLNTISEEDEAETVVIAHN